MKKTLLTISLILFAIIASAQDTITVHVTTAGTLATVIADSGANKTTVKNLTITGNIDARDIYYMRDSMSVLAVIDLSQVSIAAYDIYNANEMPQYSFYNSLLHKGKTSLTNIKLPNNITSIQNSAFSSCYNLKGNLSIPNTVTYIGDEAFYQCVEITGHLTIPNSVVNIGSFAFSSCGNITDSITIPKSVAIIGLAAFSYCYNINTIKVDINNSDFTSINGVLFNKDTTILIQYPAGKRYTNYTIPKSVKTINRNAFSNSLYLTGNIIIPNTINFIGHDAFYGCNGLSGILIIPDSITSIWSNTFYGCSGLTGNITIPKSVTYIGEYAFFDCSGFSGNLTIPNSVTEIARYAFLNCSGLKKIYTAQRSPAIIYSNTFENINKKTCQLIVPYGSKSDYIAANYWNEFENINEGSLVSFYTNGGSSVENIITYYNNALIAPTTKKVGYVFSGWYKDVGCTDVWNIKTDLVFQDTILYAKWENGYNVYFNTNGGNNISDTTVLFNTYIKEPMQPVKIGYTFSGWYKDAGFSYAWNFATDVATENTTLFAKWAINNFNIAFNTNGGNLLPNIITAYNTTTIEPSTPTKTGYTFSGWYNDTIYTNKWDFATNLITQDTTLYAKWTINSYTVSYNFNNGDPITDILILFNSKTVEPLNFTKEGYTFAGWYKDDACTITWDFETDIVTENTALYAKWTKNITITVTFEPNGGSAVTEISTAPNTLLTEPTAPTKTGYTFIGWYKDVACTKAWNFATDYITENITLYAKWNILNSVENANKTSLGFYPNPAKSYINFKGENLKQVIIYNQVGVEVLRTELSGNQQLNISTLKSGNYVMRLFSENNTTIFKLIKE